MLRGLFQFIRRFALLLIPLGRAIGLLQRLDNVIQLLLRRRVRPGILQLNLLFFRKFVDPFIEFLLLLGEFIQWLLRGHHGLLLLGQSIEMLLLLLQLFDLLNQLLIALRRIARGLAVQFLVLIEKFIQPLAQRLLLPHCLPAISLLFFRFGQFLRNRFFVVGHVVQ